MRNLLPLAALLASLPLVAQAPIERVTPATTQLNAVPSRYSAPRLNNLAPIEGVWVRSTSPVEEISANADGVELRIPRGRATVEVHHPAANVQLLIDLPGGQVALVKDGVYTFNADTDTARVLQGEASAFPGPVNGGFGSAGVKVKGDQQVVLTGNARATDANLSQLRSDLLPNSATANRQYGPEYGFRPFGDISPYDGYPYYAFGGYPYGWGDPFYDGFGLGFGFGGWYGGGFGGRRFFR